jgi:MFS family permease
VQLKQRRLARFSRCTEGLQELEFVHVDSSFEWNSKVPFIPFTGHPADSQTCRIATPYRKDLDMSANGKIVWFVGSSARKNPEARPFVLAWLVALLFYVLEYATRSSPAVMIPQLESAYSVTALGVSGILGAYYYAYSISSLLAGASIDRFGAKAAVTLGLVILAVGCFAFAVSNGKAAYGGRLLQGVGSSFAFTGAVYLASRGFSAGSLATAIGVTQCMGMLGGAAGQFLVGPLLTHGVDWKALWIFFGVAGLVLAAAQFMSTPSPSRASGGDARGWLGPYRIVLSNPQSWLCGIVAGLLFLPTTIGDMTWGVAFFQHDEQMSFSRAVTVVSMVPLGWVFGCPLFGWLTDRIGARKPVIVVGCVLMLAMVAQISYLPGLLPPTLGLFLFGVASGVAMIPYTVIKESNPDEVKGSATGIQNFLVFGISALLGPLFGQLLGKTLIGASDHAAHFREAAGFWMVAITIALVACLFLRETGQRASRRTPRASSAGVAARP